VLFFVSLLVISVAVVTPNVITEGRREQEIEMIWRGKQYVRGVRLYYQKTHRFPTQLEDLYKPNVGVRFMRQAYKDPMNTKDGSWRLICVGPNGQLLGSLKENRNAFFFGTVPSAGVRTSAPPAPGAAGTSKPVPSDPPTDDSSQPTGPPSPSSENSTLNS